jgi:hypothetical protein
MDNSSDEEDACEPTTKPNAFDVLMAPPAKKAKVDGAVDPIVIAVIYIRWLKWIDPSAPLYGCPYVGQAVRAGLTANEVAAARWADENSQAVREDKRVGLPHELRVHGATAFDSQVVEWKQGPRSAVQKWADEREIALIAERGGPLRDPSMRCKQTLNLTKGGKGHVCFEAIDASRTVAWLKFQDEMEEYIECYDTSLVPRSYVNPVSGYKLGTRLHGVRKGMLWRGHPDESKRIEWLESLPGWAWNAMETDQWREGVSERSKAQWANADEETRAEWCRRNSEAQNGPGAKAAASKRGKKQFESQEARDALSERAKAQAVREAAEGKPSLAERGKTTRFDQMSTQQYDEFLSKTTSTKNKTRECKRSVMTEEQLVADVKSKQKDKRTADRKKVRLLAYRTLFGRPTAKKEEVVDAVERGTFFQDPSGVWCARACGDQGGSQGADSSSEHAKITVVAPVAVVEPAAAPAANVVEEQQEVPEEARA